MGARVRIVTLKGRPFAVRWFDPATGTERQQSLGTREREVAEQLAKAFSENLAVSRPIELLTWLEFRERYERERMPAMSAVGRKNYGGTFKLFEKAVGPIQLRAVNAAAISQFQGSLRQRGCKEVTILTHTRRLRAALQWAYDLELIDRVPSIPKAPRGSIPRTMKGRPLSEEEFSQFLAAVDEVVQPAVAEQWKFFIKGLWFQGLRLGEALVLSWDRDDLHRVDLQRQPPMIWIRGHHEKGKRDRLHPIAPEFADLLAQVPAADRRGLVFVLPPLSRTAISHVGSDIGRAAGIRVATDPVTGREKFATLHDLRRSCALRWAQEIMPQDLQEFMRHSSIQVTMEYYVGRRPAEVAARMWSAHGRKTGVVSRDENRTMEEESGSVKDQ